MLQRAAGLEARDLLRDIFRYLVGIGVGGVVRGQHHLWVGQNGLSDGSGSMA